MNRCSQRLLLLTTMLALFAGCGVLPSVTVPTAAPAPVIAIMPTTAPVAAPELAITPGLGTELDTYFASRLKDGTFSGAALVMRGDEVVLRKGYGYADLAAQIPNTPATIYRIGNLTRPLTAAAIMLLESQGRLSLQDPICNYLDNCPPAWEPITLHHLLSDTSGIRSYATEDGFRQIATTAATPELLIGLVRDKSLYSTPGNRWALSQTNYALLGMVIERVSGQPYETFMSEQIFAPLGMTSTGYSGQPDGLAIGYQVYRSGTLPNAFDPSAAYAAYGLYSTVDDLYRWDQAIAADALLTAAQREAMYKAYAYDYDDPGWGYGYGIGLSDTHLPGHHLVLHGSPWVAYPGFYASHWSLTDLDTTVVILANQPLGESPNDDVGNIIVSEQ